MTAKRKNWELDNPEPHLEVPLTWRMYLAALAIPVALFVGVGLLYL